MTRARHILSRIALVLAVGGIAVLCLSSAWLAAAVGALTAGLVAIDMLALSRLRESAQPRPGSEPPAPDKLNVDLTRRQ